MGGIEDTWRGAPASRRELLVGLAAAATVPSLPSPAAAREAERTLSVTSPDGKLAATLHIASGSGETRVAMSSLAIRNCLAVLEGKPAVTPIV